MVDKEKKRLIVVLGMHRSGTSAVTRGLQVMGVELGDNLMPAIEGNNAKGFWEDLDLYAFNSELLSVLGSDWHYLAPNEPSYVQTLHENGYFFKAIQLLCRKIDGKAIFGFKDPRVAKLLAFWKAVFVHSQLDVSYVLAVRHPLSVARSLAARDGFDAEKSYFLWLGHVIESLTGSVGLGRVLVDYDKLMQSPEFETNRIAKRLDLEVDSVELQSYETEFLDKALQHTVYDLNDLSLDHACPQLVREIYATLLDIASDKIHLDEPVIQNQIAHWTGEYERLKPILGLADRLFAQKVIANQIIAERDEQITSLNQAIAKHNGQITTLDQTVNSLIVDRDRLQQNLKDGNIKIKGLNLELSTMMNQSKSLAEHDSPITHRSQTVAKRDDQIEVLNQTVSSLIIDRDSQKVELERAQSSVEQLRQERDAILKDKNVKIENLNLELSAVYSSNSWRVTSPLRKLITIAPSIIGNTLRVKNRRHARQMIYSPNPERNSVVKTQREMAPGMASPVFRILLVAHYWPTRAHGGGLRILDIYTLIRQQCPGIQLDLYTHHRPAIDWSLDDAGPIFNNIYLSPEEDLTSEGLATLRGSPLTYDVIDLQFHESGYQIDAFRRIGNKIIFTPMESLAKVLFIDLSTKYRTHNSLRFSSLRLLKIATALRLAAEEIDFTHKADEVVCVSRADAAFLRAATSSRHIRSVETGVSQYEFADALGPGFTTTRAVDRRCRVLYLAYFGSETNVIALHWYLEHVHPLIKSRVPGYVFTVIGRGSLSPFFKYCDDSIELVGEVPEIASHIKAARVGIAPALGGSGFRGKINQYAVMGLPCVVSPIAIKGLAYQNGVNIFVAETPEIFADRCIRLLTDLDLNDHMGQAARKLCIERYSWGSKWAAIRQIYQLEGIQ